MAASLNTNGVLYGDSTQQNTAFIGGKGQIFTSSGTFTVPTGVTAVKVTCIGGGGGGGGYSALATAYIVSAGGGGAGAGIRFVTGLTPGGTVSVTIGGGGAGGTAGTGSTGGTSSFGAYISCTGGTGGGATTGTVPTASSGGTSSSGDINITGGIGYGINRVDGCIGLALCGGGGGSSGQSSSMIWATTSGVSPEYSVATGGAGFMGLGRAGDGNYTTSTATVGKAATGYGNGGGGGVRGNTTGNATGGAGSGGIVIVEW